MQLHLLVQVLQEELAGFAVIAFGKIQRIAVRNGSVEGLAEDGGSIDHGCPLSRATASNSSAPKQFQKIVL